MDWKVVHFLEIFLFVSVVNGRPKSPPNDARSSPVKYASPPKRLYPDPKSGFKTLDKYTNLTIDQIITNALGGIDVAANKMMSPGGNILAELDMVLTEEQFLGLYEFPSSDLNVNNTKGIQLNNKQKPKEKKRKKRKIIRDERLRWTNAEIVYEFASGHFNRKERFMIKQAMTEWERYTCLKFRPATNSDRNVIRFQNGEGCNSQIGMVGGVQLLNLEAPGCRFRGLYLHEIGHSIGLVHEHQLPNRDNYIEILYRNVAPHMRIWFNKYSRQKVNQDNVNYEYSSVMHYGITAFSYDGKSQTIRAKDPSKEDSIGRVYQKELSFSDVKAVNLMYQCAALCPSNVRCKDGGYVDQNCRCVCKDGTNSCQEGMEGTTDEKCDNEYDDWQCTVWAQAGECDRNSKFMKTYCQKACKVCGRTDVDISENHFTTWAWQWFGIFTNIMPKDWIIGVLSKNIPC